MPILLVAGRFSEIGRLRADIQQHCCRMVISGLSPRSLHLPSWLESIIALKTCEGKPGTETEIWLYCTLRARNPVRLDLRVRMPSFE